MKRVLWMTMAIAMSCVAVAWSGDEAKDAKAAKTPTSLTGEVVDLYCYMQHPESATGEGHASCAKGCVAKGLPVGFLTADGTMYVIIGKDHMAAGPVVGEWVGKQSTITGHVSEQKGIKAIELVSIGAVKG